MLHVISTVLAVVFSLLSALSTIGAAGEAPGAPAFDQEAFSQEFQSTLNCLTLGLFPNGSSMDITMDETMQEAFDSLEGDSGFALAEIAGEVPDFFYYLRWMYALNPNIYNTLRDTLLAKSNEREAAGDDVLKVVDRILGASIAMPTGLHIYSVERAYLAGGHRVMFDLVYADGSHYAMDTGVNYHPETGIFSQYDVGVASTGFDVNVKEGYAYSAVNPQLQRFLKYSKLYDIAFLKTNDMVNVLTVRLQFEYQGQDWMLQLWKGRYFIGSGGEVGLYHKEKDTFGGEYAFYDCAGQDERIPMSFRLYEKNSEVAIMARPLTLHWWMTGFCLQDTLYPPEQLRLETEVIPADAEMLAGLIGALDKQVLAGELTYELRDNNTLAIVW